MRNISLVTGILIVVGCIYIWARMTFTDATDEEKSKRDDGPYL